VLNGEVGDFVSIAREERGTGNWFVGAITDENPRDVEIDFSFLPEGSSFTATIYRDGEQAHFRENPTAIEIEKQTVDRNSKLQFRLAAGGGMAISLMKE
jgi:hypothetical protein